jgi:hypothetical protein
MNSRQLASWTLPFCLFAFAAPPIAAKCEQFTIGMNKFDLPLQYIGRASGGDGSTEQTTVTRAMAHKAIDDATHLGISYFRFAASGFGPSHSGEMGDLDLWLKEPSRYWSLIDQMIADLQIANICFVPVLVWNRFQFPAMASEPLAALVRSDKSVAWGLLSRYVREFVLRYRSSPNLLFYELTNELNLQADIDAERDCARRRSAAQCSIVSNFSTDDMDAFVKRFAELVRSLDSSHRISSGFALPRVAAQHIRKRPQWSRMGADWTADSAEELEANLRDTHASVDIISVHLYPPTSLRLGLIRGEEFKIVDIIQSAAARIGKPLFIGEFGQADVAHEPSNSFASNMIRELKKANIPYSAAWVFEFYQFATDAPYGSEASSFSLEPGYTDSLLQEIDQVNRGQRVADGNPNPNAARFTPNVVLTKPLACANITPGDTLFSVASFAGRPVASVTFLIDGKEIGRVVHPPYRLTLPLLDHMDRVAEIEARACSSAEICSSYKTKVILGHGSEVAQQCTVALSQVQ